MENKEKLFNLLTETTISQSDLRKKIYSYLMQKYDIMVVKIKVDEILSGNLENITEEDMIEIINLLGGEAETPAKIEPKIEQPKIDNEKIEDERRTLADSYNVMLAENEKLRRENKKLKENQDDLTKDNQMLSNRLTKLERIIESLQQYNITNTAELVEVEDELINELYLKYLTEGVQELDNGLIFKTDSSVIIPKTYYKVDKRGE